MSSISNGGHFMYYIKKFKKAIMRVCFSFHYRAGVDM